MAPLPYDLAWHEFITCSKQSFQFSVQMISDIYYNKENAHMYLQMSYSIEERRAYSYYIRLVFDTRRTTTKEYTATAAAESRVELRARWALSAPITSNRQSITGTRHAVSHQLIIRYAYETSNDICGGYYKTRYGWVAGLAKWWWWLMGLVVSAITFVNNKHKHLSPILLSRLQFTAPSPLTKRQNLSHTTQFRFNLEELTLIKRTFDLRMIDISRFLN